MGKTQKKKIILKNKTKILVTVCLAPNTTASIGAYAAGNFSDKPVRVIFERI